MATGQDDALREMARHRGLRLRKSRRRKPGGDFGNYGLTDPDGKPVFGFKGKALTASAEDVEAYLRGAMVADWKGSTKGLRRKAAPKPPPPPPPPPKLKVKTANLLAKLPAARRAEAFTELFARPGIRIERIVSRGQSTPDDEPMRQDHDEWVLLLAGEAGLRIESSDEVVLRPGDYLLIEHGRRHWVTRTSDDPAAVWLAVHLGRS